MSLLATPDGRAIQSIFETIASYLPEYVNKICEKSPYREVVAKETYYVNMLQEPEIHGDDESSLPSEKKSKREKERKYADNVDAQLSLPPIAPDDTSFKKGSLLPTPDSEHIYSTVVYIRSDPPDMILLRSILFEAGGGPALDAAIANHINNLAEGIYDHGPPILPFEATSVMPAREHLRSIVSSDGKMPKRYDISEVKARPISPKVVQPCVSSSLTPRNGIVIKIFLKIHIDASSSSMHTSAFPSVPPFGSPSHIPTPNSGAVTPLPSNPSIPSNLSNPSTSSTPSNSSTPSSPIPNHPPNYSSSYPPNYPPTPSHSYPPTNPVSNSPTNYPTSTYLHYPPSSPSLSPGMSPYPPPSSSPYPSSQTPVAYPSPHPNMRR